MRLDPIIQRELEPLDGLYSIRKSKDHYFVVVDGHKPIVIGGNHNRHRARLVQHTVTALRKLRKDMEGK